MASLSICVFSSLPVEERCKAAKFCQWEMAFLIVQTQSGGTDCLGGLNTDGTTFGWTPGDQRADIQVASRVLRSRCWGPCCTTFSSTGW